MQPRLRVALIDGDAKASPRIDVEQRFMPGNVAEGPHEWHGVGLSRQGELYLIADAVTKFCKLGSFDVGDQVSKGTIGGNDFAAETGFLHLRRGQVEADQLRHHRTDLRPIIAARKVSA